MPPARLEATDPTCDGVTLRLLVTVVGSSVSLNARLAHEMTLVTTSGSDWTSEASWLKNRLPNIAPSPTTARTTRLPTSAVARPRFHPRSVSQLMAGSMAIANSQDSSKRNRKWLIDWNTHSAIIHSVTISRTVSTARRSARCSRAISFTGSAGGVEDGTWRDVSSGMGTPFGTTIAGPVREGRRVLLRAVRRRRDGRTGRGRRPRVGGTDPG